MGRMTQVSTPRTLLHLSLPSQIPGLSKCLDGMTKSRTQENRRPGIGPSGKRKQRLINKMYAVTPKMKLKKIT